MKSPVGWMRHLWAQYKGLRIRGPGEGGEKALVSKMPEPNELSSGGQKRAAGYDQLTHTGQAWDAADPRRARFEYAPKQVNPNIAAHLIAELAPVPSEDSVVWCDGGHRHGGHPKVFINLDKPGMHACGYCGQRFFNVHATKPEQMDQAHIQV